MKQECPRAGSRPRDPADALTPADLFRMHGRTVLAICLANTANRQDAEDIMQETFLKAIAKFQDLRDHRGVRPWILQIARRTCIDHRRRRRPAEHLPDETPAPSLREDPLVERLRESVQRLPRKYREAVTLYYLDGRTASGVAACLNVTEAAVRQRLVRARAMLHDSLREEVQ